MSDKPKREPRLALLYDIHWLPDHLREFMMTDLYTDTPNDSYVRVFVEDLSKDSPNNKWIKPEHIGIRHELHEWFVDNGYNSQYPTLMSYNW
jgi:hypothetical protein